MVGRVAERFGVRPSQLLKGSLLDLLLDVDVLGELAKEDARIAKKARRRMR